MTAFTTIIALLIFLAVSTMGFANGYQKSWEPFNWLFFIYGQIFCLLISPVVGIYLFQNSFLFALIWLWGVFNFSTLFGRINAWT